MTWVKIDIGYLRHPKLSGLPTDAKVLHLASILWTAEHLTDGHVPHRSLTDLSQIADIHPRWAKRRAATLVEAGLWDLVPGGWHVHDFEEHNRTSTREYVQAEREAWRERQRRARSNVTPLHRYEGE
jgi:hypothetical protein